jgi:hypothetical protein
MIFDFALPAGRDPLATRTISPMSSAAMSRRHYLAGKPTRTIKNGRVNVTSTPGALVWYACCTWSSLRVYYLLANCEQIVCLLLPVHYGNAHLSWSNQVRMYCSLSLLSIEILFYTCRLQMPREHKCWCFLQIQILGCTFMFLTFFYWLNFVDLW